MRGRGGTQCSGEEEWRRSSHGGGTRVVAAVGAADALTACRTHGRTQTCRGTACPPGSPDGNKQTNRQRTNMSGPRRCTPAAQPPQRKHAVLPSLVMAEEIKGALESSPGRRARWGATAQGCRCRGWLGAPPWPGPPPPGCAAHRCSAGAGRGEGPGKMGREGSGRLDCCLDASCCQHTYKLLQESGRASTFKLWLSSPMTALKGSSSLEFRRRTRS